jgi:hypothetical protein
VIGPSNNEHLRAVDRALFRIFLSESLYIEGFSNQLLHQLWPKQIDKEIVELISERPGSTLFSGPPVQRLNSVLQSIPGGERLDLASEKISPSLASALPLGYRDRVAIAHRLIRTRLLTTIALKHPSVTENFWNANFWDSQTLRTRIQEVERLLPERSNPRAPTKSEMLPTLMLAKFALEQIEQEFRRLEAGTPRGAVRAFYLNLRKKMTAAHEDFYDTFLEWKLQAGVVFIDWQSGDLGNLRPQLREDDEEQFWDRLELTTDEQEEIQAQTVEIENGIDTLDETIRRHFGSFLLPKRTELAALASSLLVRAHENETSVAMLINSRSSASIPKLAVLPGIDRCLIQNCVILADLESAMSTFREWAAIFDDPRNFLMRTQTGLPKINDSYDGLDKRLCAACGADGVESMFKELRSLLARNEEKLIQKKYGLGNSRSV